MSFDKIKALKLKNHIESLSGQLIAVSKKFKVEEIKKAKAIGINDFGENYVDEALEKMGLLSEEKDIKWHFIGKVQSNNINKMINRFEVIHSLFKLKHIKKFSQKSSSQQKILLQIRHEKDLRENGVYLKDLENLFDQVKTLPMINLKGLMFMPPEDFTRDQLSVTFHEVKEAFDSLSPKRGECDWDMLSMGMSSDFEIALEKGATHVRIGTAVFGPRK